MKRRIFKQFLSGILGILLLLSLAGCGQSTSDSKPDDTMEAFYDLIIKQDTTSMTDLGIDDSEASDTLKTYQTSMISTLQKSFKNAGVTITKKQANEIYKATNGFTDVYDGMRYQPVTDDNMYAEPISGYIEKQ